MPNNNKQFIPIAFLPYGEGNHYILKTPQEDPDYYYCLYPDYELAQISTAETQDALVIHDYRELDYDGDAVKEDELSSVLENMDPEED